MKQNQVLKLIVITLFVCVFSGSLTAKEVAAVKQKSSDSFEKFKDHFSKYYPKVFLVREKFLSNMTPDHIAKTLQDIINMLSDQPWLYVEQLFKDVIKHLPEDKRNGLNDQTFTLEFLDDHFRSKKIKKWLKRGGGCWEFITDQVCFYSEFVEMCRVNLKDGSVYLQDLDDYWSSYYQRAPSRKGKTQSLKSYWKEHGITVHHDLYALSFDYYGKLFLEGILNKDLNQAYRMSDDLKIIMEKLRGTAYESQRQEDLKIYKQLLDILKEKKRIDNGDDMGKGKYYNEINEFYDMD